MSLHFEERTAKVLVIEPSNTTRTLFTECLRGIGFNDVNGLGSVKDAINILEVDEVQWIITNSFAEDTENCLNLLRLITTCKELGNVLVSMVFDSNEEEIVSTAFMNGLFSCHIKNSTKEAIQGELESLMERFESYQWNPTLTSASYLRSHLLNLEKYEEILGFERRLIEIFPGDVGQIFNIVGPLAKLGRLDQAKSTLFQIKMLAPELAEKVEQFSEDYLDGAPIERSQEDGLNILGLSKVVVVDSDDMIVNALKSIFDELGVSQFEGFDNGEQAYEFIEANSDVDLIIMEWRIPKLTAPLLIQRLSKIDANKAPIIIQSSLIQETDHGFIREMGVAAILSKPLDRKAFLKSLLWVVQQEAMPTDQSMLERKIRAAIKERNHDELSELKTRFIEDPNISYGSKQLIEAEIYFAQAKFEKARHLAIEAIRYNGDSLLVLNLLGKILMNLQDFDSALKCFEKAQSLSPQNLERLCQIAEVHSELGNEEEAEKSLQQAEKMDADSQSVAETKAKNAIRDGDSERAKQLLSQLDVLEDVISYMNNQAIALARCDKFELSFSQYEKALLAIPDDREDVKAIICYNRGLAYIRAGDLEKAQQDLEEAGSIKQSRVYEKSKVLSKKVNKAKELNIDVKLSSRSDTPVSNGSVEEDVADTSLPDEVRHGSKASEQSTGELAGGDQNARNESMAVDSILSLKPGEFNLYLIYSSKENSELATKMLSTMPRFKQRDAIEREESAGADRLLASANG